MLFRNLGERRFENASAAMGPEFNRPIVAGGAAYAYCDHDGDLDAIVSTNNGPHTCSTTMAAIAITG
jgi:hypothetical protein